MGNLSRYKITSTSIAQKGVAAAPDTLTGTAQENKAIFDRLVRETVRTQFNGLIDALDNGGVSDVGAHTTTELSGLLYGDGAHLSAKPLGASGGAAEHDATWAALNAKAPIASPTFTGKPKAPTAAAGTSTTQLATTAFVQNGLADKTPIVGKGVNLLDNWYFGEGVIDQRAGMMIVGGGLRRGYSASGPTVDRWTLISEGDWYLDPFDTGHICDGEPCLRLFPNALMTEHGQTSLYQTLELRGAAAPLTLTLSFLLHAGAVSLANETVSFGLSWSADNAAFQAAEGARGVVPDAEGHDRWALVSASFQVPETARYLRADLTLVPHALTPDGRTDPGSVRFRAAKLELGSAQTLARQVNGAWALNDPAPNYQHELAKCQRYQSAYTQSTRILAANRAANYFDFPLFCPAPMREKPTLSGGEFSVKALVNGSMTAQSGFSVGVQYVSGNIVFLRATKPSHGIIDSPAVVLESTSAFVLDANL